VGESLSVLAGDGDTAVVAPGVVAADGVADSWVEQAVAANRIKASKRADIGLFRDNKWDSLIFAFLFGLFFDICKGLDR